jgi:F-type H+-transporting ATPase subunit b
MLFAKAAASSSGGGNFLLPNGTFVVDLVIFLIVFGVMAKWILPPLQQVVEARRTRIRGALDEAEQARAEARSVLAERDRLLAEARGQARSLIDKANQGADAAFEQERKSGQDEYARLVAAFKVETAQEGRRARQELAGQLDTLVVAAAGRVLGAPIDASRHRELIDQAIAQAATPEAGQD